MYLNIFQPLDKLCYFNVFPKPEVKGLVSIDLSMISSSSSKLVPLTATVDCIHWHWICDQSLLFYLWSPLMEAQSVSRPLEFSLLFSLCVIAILNTSPMFCFYLEWALMCLITSLACSSCTVEERWMKGAQGRERGQKTKGENHLEP